MQHLQSIRVRYKALRLARQRLVKAMEAALWRRKDWEDRGAADNDPSGKVRRWVWTGQSGRFKPGTTRLQISKPYSRQRGQPAGPLQQVTDPQPQETTPMTEQSDFRQPLPPRKARRKAPARVGPKQHEYQNTTDMGRLLFLAKAYLNPGHTIWSATQDDRGRKECVFQGISAALLRTLPLDEEQRQFLDECEVASALPGARSRRGANNTLHDRAEARVEALWQQMTFEHRRHLYQAPPEVQMQVFLWRALAGVPRGFHNVSPEALLYPMAIVQFLSQGKSPWRQIQNAEATVTDEVVTFFKQQGRELVPLVRDMIGQTPWKTPTIRDVPVTPEVSGLRQEAWDSADAQGRLEPVVVHALADALEEAGAPDVVIQGLRTPGPKYRGHWALLLVSQACHARGRA